MSALLSTYSFFLPPNLFPAPENEEGKEEQESEDEETEDEAMQTDCHSEPPNNFVQNEEDNEVESEQLPPLQQMKHSIDRYLRYLSHQPMHHSNKFK